MIVFERGGKLVGVEERTCGVALGSQPALVGRRKHLRPTEKVVSVRGFTLAKAEPAENVTSMIFSDRHATYDRAVDGEQLEKLLGRYGLAARHRKRVLQDGVHLMRAY